MRTKRAADREKSRIVPAGSGHTFARGCRRISGRSGVTVQMPLHGRPFRTYNGKGKMA